MSPFICETYVPEILKKKLLKNGGVFAFTIIKDTESVSFSNLTLHQSLWIVKFLFYVKSFEKSIQELKMCVHETRFHNFYIKL